MTATLHYAFMDEAGNVALSRQNHVLIVAALCAETPRSINRIIRKAQKKYGSSLASGELKAKKAETRLVDAILTGLAREPIEVFAVIVDRRMLKKPPKDPEEIYRWVMARLVKKLVARFPRIEIAMDRRYTTEHLRYLLEKAVREGISDLPQQYVLIRQEDSILAKELQAVDFIAWALFQKYERGIEAFYQRIAPRIAEEELITKQIWEREWK